MIKSVLGLCVHVGLISTIIKAAPPSIAVNNFSGSPIEVISSSSPLFMQLLTTFCGSNTVEILRPILPYVVIARNNSSSTIVLITVRVNLEDTNGSVVANTYSLAIRGSGTAPGELVLMTPVSGLSRPLKHQVWTPSLQNADHLSEVISDKVRRYEEMSAVRISLDSVIFSDDSLIGPDLAGKLTEENTERSARRQLASELLNQKPSERSAYLTTIGSDLQAQQADVTDPRNQRLRWALAFQSTIVATNGDETMFRSTMADIIKNQTNEVRRRNP